MQQTQYIHIASSDALRILIICFEHIGAQGSTKPIPGYINISYPYIEYSAFSHVTNSAATINYKQKHMKLLNNFH